MQSSNEISEFNEIDIKQYFELIMRRKFIFFLMFIIPLVFATIYTINRKPIFRAVSHVEVNSGIRIPISDKVYNAKVRDHIYKQIEILEGKTLQQRVLNSIDPDFLSTIPEKWRIPDLTIQKTKGQILEIHVDSPYREYTLIYLKKLIEEFTQLKMEHREKSSYSVLFNLSQEAELLNTKIKKVQDKIHDYRSKNSDVFLEENSNYYSSNLMRLSNRLSEITTQRNLISRKIQTLEQSTDPSLWISIIDNLQQDVLTTKTASTTSNSSSNNSNSSSQEQTNLHPSSGANTNTNTNTQGSMPFLFVVEKEQTVLWKKLSEKYRTLKSELLRIQSLYKPKHPKRTEIELALVEVTQQMDLEVKGLLEQFKANHKALLLEEKTISDELNSWKIVSLASLTKVNEFNIIKDEEDRLKKLYSVLLQRIEEISTSIDFNLESILEVEEARILPDPVAPKKIRDFLMFFMLSLGFAFGLIILLDYLDDSIKSLDELKNTVAIQGLGQIPKIEWNQNNLNQHLITKIKDHTIIESFRSIRTNILLTKSFSKLKTILFTSAVPSEGKTTTIANVGIILAQGGKKVLIIDSDLRRPTLHKMFGMKNTIGFSNLLEQPDELNRCIIKTEFDTLDIITAGHIVPDPAKLLHASQVNDVLMLLEEKYDIVLIDSAPILTVADTVILSEIVKSIILVVHGGKTSTMLLKKAKDLLNNNVNKIMGGILNNLSFKESKNYYYYKYNYNYGASTSAQKKSKAKLPFQKNESEEIKV